MSNKEKAQILILVIFIIGIAFGSLITFILDKDPDPEYLSIMEYCIKEEALTTMTPYVRMGSTTAVFIEDEQGTHVVKLCE